MGMCHLTKQSKKCPLRCTWIYLSVCQLSVMSSYVLYVKPHRSSLATIDPWDRIIGLGVAATFLCCVACTVCTSAHHFHLQEFSKLRSFCALKMTHAEKFWRLKIEHRKPPHSVPHSVPGLHAASAFLRSTTTGSTAFAPLCEIVPFTLWKESRAQRTRCKPCLAQHVQLARKNPTFLGAWKRCTGTRAIRTCRQVQNQNKLNDIKCIYCTWRVACFFPHILSCISWW